MNDDSLLERVRRRAIDPRRRTDANRTQSGQHDAASELGRRATPADVASAEDELAFPLPVFYRRLLTEIGDGGFGPGYGLYGIGADAEGLDGEGGALQVRGELGFDEGQLPPTAIPLVDFGCASWALMDASTERCTVLLLTEGDLYETELDLRGWLEAWAEGAAGEDLLYDESKATRREGINPFTKQPVIFVGHGPVRGRLLRRLGV